MHLKTHIILIFLTFLLFCVHAEGAVARKNWDRILDRYEALCGECIDMKNRVESGEKISSKDISKLLNSLGKIREELKDGSGSMTQEQVERFESIRATYQSAFAPQEKGVEGNSLKIGNTESTADTQPDYITLQPKTVEAKTTAVDESPKTESKATSRQAFQSIPQMESLSSVIEYRNKTDISISRTAETGQHERQRALSISASALISVFPDPAYGFMLTLSASEIEWGAYAKCLSNFKNAPYSYECSSTDESLWLNGNSNIALHQFSAGVTRSIGDKFGAFAGIGYGVYTTTWEDSFGQWMRVTDYSTKGLLLEAGLSYSFSKVKFTGGVCITGLHYTNLFLGVGIQF